MTDAREAILAAIRAGRGDAVPEAPPPRAPLPARAQGAPEALVARFVEMALLAGATASRAAGADGVAGAVAEYLSRGGLGGAVVLSPDPAVAGLDWDRAPRLTVLRGAGREEMASAAATVTGAVCGVAETGTLMVRAGGPVANALHLLPEAHIAVLRASDIVGGYEAARARLGAELPRAVTFITGPSRTADIEKTPQIGVHGPRRLHIVLVDDA
jgi:L-lactate dehydrogenase complex protein LldG